MSCHPRRFLWLDQAERGALVSSIARRYRLAVPVVQAAIDDARAQLVAHAEAMRLMTPPPLYMTFPLSGLFPDSRCSHDVEPIAAGSLACCAVCHQSGRDNHPALERFPAVEPRPDPAPRPTLAQAEPAPMTRRQKRAAAAAKRASKKQSAA